LRARRVVAPGHDILKTALPHTRSRGLLILLAATFLGFFQACAKGPPKLSPVPDRVESLDGFGSISVRGGEVTAKSRFAFVFRLPDEGRIEALDVLGRTMAVLIFREGASHLILPTKRVYWKGPEEELMDKFIGFGLRASELSRLIGGLWKDPPAGEAAPESAWSIERDGQGRPFKGGRGGFRFETVEFFRGAAVPRTIVFSGPESSGRLRVLKIHFNPARRGDPFGTSSLDGFREVEWAEMEAVLRDED